MGSFRHRMQTVECQSSPEAALPHWRRAIDALFPPLRVSPLAPEGFRGALRSAASDSLQLVEMTANAHIVERDPGVLHTQSRDYYKLSLQISGSGIMRQGGREITLTPGTITVYDTGRAYDLRFEEPYRFVIAMFPKAALSLPTGVAGELSGCALSSSDGIGAITAAYLRSLTANLALLSSSSGDRLTAIGIDLLTTLVTSHLSLSDVDHGGWERRSLRAEILHYITDHLGDPALNPDLIAQAHFISVRHLYNVFTETGTSVAQHIKHRRFEAAKRDLSDPAFAHLTIAEIASRWTLADNAYFGRVFKETYGETPGQWRRRNIETRTLAGTVSGTPLQEFRTHHTGDSYGDGFGRSSVNNEALTITAE